jgi:hypothetical protein
LVWIGGTSCWLIGVRVRVGVAFALSVVVGVTVRVAVSVTVAVAVGVRVGGSGRGLAVATRCKPRSDGETQQLDRIIAPHKNKIGVRDIAYLLFCVHRPASSLHRDSGNYENGRATRSFSIEILSPEQMCGG